MEDDIEQELLEAEAANKRSLSDYAASQEWTLDVQIDECDCGNTHIAEGWWWGHGFIWTDPEGFCVTFDPDPDDLETEVRCYEAADIADALFLIDTLSASFAAVPMPDYPDS